MTVGCINPPRGGGKTTSWYGVGFRIDAGAATTSVTNPLGNHTFMVALQSYKLKLLRKSVDASKAKRSKTVDWLALEC